MCTLTILRKLHSLCQYRYKEGVLVAKEDLKGQSIDEVEQAAENMLGLMEEGNEEQVHDNDIDDLLGWTNALNFEE